MDHEVINVKSEEKPVESINQPQSAMHPPQVETSSHTSSQDSIHSSSKPDTGMSSMNSKFIPFIVELSSPHKALRTGKLRDIRSEPRPMRRSNSSGPPRSPRVSTEDLIDPIFEESVGLRRRKKYSHNPTSKISPTNSLPFGRHNRPRSRYVIPVEHPFKIVWDVLTIIFAIAHMLKTHEDIRDRQFSFGASPFKVFCDVWFFVDILLNFVTERKSTKGEVYRDYRSICARYLTSWFPIDLLSLFPWETLYVQPIIEIQNRRGAIEKVFFRSRAVIRVITNRLRIRHFRWFGTVARHTKHHGVGSARLLRLVIKYLPKYNLFFRNMKGVVMMRALRQVHWLGRFCKNIEKSDATVTLSRDGFDDGSSRQDSADVHHRAARMLDYEDWEQLEDDGVPF